MALGKFETVRALQVGATARIGGRKSACVPGNSRPSARRDAAQRNPQQRRQWHLGVDSDGGDVSMVGPVGPRRKPAWSSSKP